MKFGWRGYGKNNSIVISGENWESLWNADAWSKSKLKGGSVIEGENLSYTVFAVLNDFLLTLNQVDATTLENIYRDLNELLNDSVGVPVLDLNNVLYTLINEICVLVNYESFREWCLLNGKINIAIGTKDTLNETDSADITYFTQDYTELAVFSTYLKLLTPILGMYHSVQKQALGDEQVLLNILTLINNEVIANNVAFVRLTEYAITLCAKRLDSINYVLLTELSTDELVDYCIVVVLWKRIILFDVRSQVSLVRNVYNGFKDQLAKLSGAGPTEKYHKGSTSSGREDQSVADVYKVIIEIPPATVVDICTYIRHNGFLKKLNPNVTEREVSEIHSFIDTLDIRPSHLTIIAATCKHVIPKRDVQYTDYLTTKHLIAMSAACLYDWGLPTLAEFITLIPTVKIASIVVGGGVLIKPVESELQELANKKYSVIGGPMALLELRDELLKELTCYEWRFTRGNVGDFNNELFKLILRD
jgi:hypothetical protein